VAVTFRRNKTTKENPNNYSTALPTRTELNGGGRWVKPVSETIHGTVTCWAPQALALTSFSGQVNKAPFFFVLRDVQGSHFWVKVSLHFYPCHCAATGAGTTGGCSRQRLSTPPRA
jgi:hypothetical protein